MPPRHRCTVLMVFAPGTQEPGATLGGRVLPRYATQPIYRALLPPVVQRLPHRRRDPHRSP